MPQPQDQEIEQINDKRNLAYPPLVPWNRKVPGEGTKLDFIKKNKPVYHRMLLYIMRGSTQGVVATAMGVDSTTLSLWLAKGKQHRSKNKKSLYADLYRDIQAARAQARANAEMEVSKSDPKFWLTKSPARHIDGVDDWDATVEVDMKIDAEMRHELSRAPATPATMAAALEVLEEIGIIQRTEKGKALFSTNGKNGHVDGEFEE